MSSVMNGLRVSWAQYMLLSLCLLPKGVMGNNQLYPPLIIRLTMANHEHSKLRSVLGDAPQKMYPSDFPL